MCGNKRINRFNRGVGRRLKLLVRKFVVDCECEQIRNVPCNVEATEASDARTSLASGELRTASYALFRVQRSPMQSSIAGQRTTHSCDRGASFVSPGSHHKYSVRAGFVSSFFHLPSAHSFPQHVQLCPCAFVSVTTLFITQHECQWRSSSCEDNLLTACVASQLSLVVYQRQSSHSIKSLCIEA